MKDLESVFLKEFGREMGSVGRKNIFSVPLPKEASSWKVSKSDAFLVRGVKETQFKGLEGKVVYKVPRGYVAKRRVIDKVTRSYKTDENGFVYQDIPVPTGSMVVLSDVNLLLPYTVLKSEDEYGYVDFYRKEDGSRGYMYILPKKVLYKVHQTALALSVKNMKNYSGMGYKTWDYGLIFLHVIPFNPNSVYTGTKILKTENSLNYREEISSIVKYWEDNEIIPKLSLCSTLSGENCTMKGTVVGYESYEPFDMLAVGDKEIYGSVDGGLEE